MDVHHRWATDAELLEYLPRKWRDFMDLPGGRLMPMSPGGGAFNIPKSTAFRMDAWSPTGQVPGSDYEMFRSQLLDPYRMAAVVLSFDIGQQQGIFNGRMATAVLRAANDWSIERWLSRDDPRLYGAMLVSTQEPEEAAAEIRRVGAHPRIVEALLVVNGMGKPFGHPVYHPIYEAAAELDLTIAIHIGAENLVTGGQANAAGIMGSRFEQHSTNMHPIQTHLSSFIVNGAFEKFPGLRLLLVEAGVAWAPWLLWELDAQYAALKKESPWVKKLPSEYFREHVRLSTQPLELTPQRGQLIELLDSFGGFENILCFATDYPHWDFDNPDFISTRFPESWWPGLFFDNSAVFYRWSVGAHQHEALRA
ncbi:amidohydrolase family protein [Pseudonocardia sp. GCM10023141]|uniref:amidohydrolase family protein n=1 Tax=Pseudonocardia sp. GCM10023141 TaxID=3252653 RepID=UPI00362365CF